MAKTASKMQPQNCKTFSTKTNVENQSCVPVMVERDTHLSLMKKLVEIQRQITAMVTQRTELIMQMATLQTEKEAHHA